MLGIRSGRSNGVVLLHVIFVFHVLMRQACLGVKG